MNEEIINFVCSRHHDRMFFFYSTYAEQLQPNEENIQDNIEPFAVETIWTMNETRYLAPWSTSKTGPFYLRAKIEEFRLRKLRVINLVGL